MQNPRLSRITLHGTDTKEITEDIGIVKLHISDLQKTVIPETNSTETIIKTQ